jgi:deoxyribodipyrimidine photolyase
MQTAWPQILKSVCNLKDSKAISASMAGRLILSLHTRLTQRMQSLLTSDKTDAAVVQAYLASYEVAQQILGRHLHVDERRIAQAVLALMRDEDEVCTPCAQGVQVTPTELANQALEMAGFSSRIRHNPQDGARVVNQPNPRDFTHLRMPVAVEAVLF